jgi:cobalt-zinc-cadmium efflux system outer membrane protein
VTQALGGLEWAGTEARTIREQVMPGAQSAYDAATQGFELGKFNFLDVLDAQRTLFQAQAQYLRARGEAHRASADLDRLLGDVDTAGESPRTR